MSYGPVSGAVVLHAVFFVVMSSLTFAPLRPEGNSDEPENFYPVMTVEEPLVPLLADPPAARGEAAEWSEVTEYGAPDFEMSLDSENVSGSLVLGGPVEQALRRLDKDSKVSVVTGTRSAVASVRSQGAVTANASRQNIFGMGIDGNARIGLILDISPSMEPIVEQVLHEIYRSFPRSATVTIDSGAIRIENQKKYQYRLMDNQFRHFYQLEELPHVDFQVIRAVQRYTQGRAIHYFEFLDGAGHLMRSGADVIYWVTDFQDSSDPEALTYLRNWLLSQGVKLYVHSVDAPAPQEIRKLAQITGGVCILEPVM